MKKSLLLALTALTLCGCLEEKFKCDDNDKCVENNTTGNASNTTGDGSNSTGDSSSSVCETDAFRCIDEHTLHVCKNNEWTLDKTCGENEVCSETEKQCVCAKGLTNCSGQCVDLNTDVNHCGKCDNAINTEKYDCQDKKVCTLSGSKYEDSEPTGCCDSDAKLYYYFLDRDGCDNTKDPIKFESSSDDQDISDAYCLTQDQVHKISNNKICLLSEEDKPYYNNPEKCGTQDYHPKCKVGMNYKYTNVEKEEEYFQKCLYGKCCLPDGLVFGTFYGGGQHLSDSFAEENFNAKDCCSGSAYLHTVTVGEATYENTINCVPSDFKDGNYAKSYCEKNKGIYNNYYLCTITSNNQKETIQML